uniref:Putative ovule protein n=1 Tax=Solanum chacoense TaxID=4108 RepID=A0A0V0H802_SOLCH
MVSLDSLYGLGIRVRLFPIYDLPCWAPILNCLRSRCSVLGLKRGVKSHIGWDVVNFDSLYGLGQSSPHNLNLGLS